MSDFELDPADRDDDYPYDYVYIHEESGRLWPVVIGITLLLISLAAYMLEERYTRPPKVETAPTWSYAVSVQSNEGMLFVSTGYPLTHKFPNRSAMCPEGKFCDAETGAVLDRFGESCDKHVWAEAKSEAWVKARYEDCGGHSMVTGAGKDAEEVPFWKVRR